MKRTAGMTLYNVTIEFDDGTYKVKAWSNDETHAKHLALLDARMATPAHPCYSGKVKSITATVER